jgi:drug/metabolite transporter (DMT)-like permease
MAAPRDRRRFVSKGSAGNGSSGSPTKRSASTSSAAQPDPSKAGNRKAGQSKGRASNQVIPDAVANRMARRIALATGLPTLLGMAVFIASYLLVSRRILDIPPSATLLASGGCFLLGLLGLSYGVLSASWENEPGSLVGTEQIGLNMERIRSSLRAMRQGNPGTPEG